MYFYYFIDIKIILLLSKLKSFFIKLNNNSNILNNLFFTKIMMHDITNNL